MLPQLLGMRQNYDRCQLRHCESCPPLTVGPAHSVVKGGGAILWGMNGQQLPNAGCALLDLPKHLQSRCLSAAGGCQGFPSGSTGVCMDSACQISTPSFTMHGSCAWPQPRATHTNSRSPQP